MTKVYCNSVKRSKNTEECNILQGRVMHGRVPWKGTEKNTTRSNKTEINNKDEDLLPERWSRYIVF